MVNKSNKKLLMIGLDATDHEYLTAYLPHLPHLKQLFSAGDFVTLNTSADVLDASVWPTFNNGELPGDYGMYFPFQWNPATMRYHRHKPDWLPYRPFWNQLGAAGVKVGLLDIPMVPMPPPPATNIEYYHWQSQDEGNPAGVNTTPLGKQLLSQFGEHPLNYDIVGDKTRGQLNRIKQAAISGAVKRGEITRWLMDNSEWDLFISVFSELHRAGHYFCPDPHASDSIAGSGYELLDVYRAADQAVGTITENLDLNQCGVIIFSLHGMGPNNSQAHFLPKLLDRLNVNYSRDSQVAVTSTQPQRGVMRFLREKLPGQFQYFIAGLVNQRARDWVVNRAYTGGMNWHRVPAFNMLSGGQGFIRLNLEGRETVGLLERDSEQLHDYVGLLKDTLRSLRNADTGDTLVKDILETRSEYPGTYSDYLPDIVIIWEDRAPAERVVCEQMGALNARLGTGRGGNHRPNAFAVINAPSSHANRGEPPAHIADFAGYVRRQLTP